MPIIDEGAMGDTGGEFSVDPIPEFNAGGVVGAFDAVRRLALKGNELARDYVGTVCLKLLKVGAVVVRNTRRVQL